jgi:hypothetical protein
LFSAQLNPFIALSFFVGLPARYKNISLRITKLKLEFHYKTELELFLPCIGKFEYLLE